jgi:polyphosphate kinase 2 (PPK2 family)
MLNILIPECDVIFQIIVPQWAFNRLSESLEEEEDLVSISSMFFEKLLRMQILKAQKKSNNLTVFFLGAFGICSGKSYSLNVDEIDPRSLRVMSFSSNTPGDADQHYSARCLQNFPEQGKEFVTDL